jgi:hypothetical protein
MALKDLEIKNFKPPEKPQKHYDGLGLFLYLAPSGLKSGGTSTPSRED